MQSKSFGHEFRDRAGIIAGMAVFNPLLLAAYLAIYDLGEGALLFWLVGCGLTSVICVGTAIALGVAIHRERGRRHYVERSLAKWDAVIPKHGRFRRPGMPTQAG